MNCITASCKISHSSIYRNGQQVFANQSANLPGFLLSAYQFLDNSYPKFYKMDNLSKLGWLAAEVLLKDEIHTRPYRPEETGLVLVNANSSLDTDLKYYETVKEIPSPALFVYTLPNIMIGEICIRNNFKGESAFFISPAFDAGFIERTVNDLLNNNILQACICGWVDLLEEDYTAVLYLVEKKEDGAFPPFIQSMIHKIFQGENE
ncbi:MAG TPA: hypothetical protein VL832_04695 [Puia sp.]|nr:hypothetical protein [Puia sp.]